MDFSMTREQLIMCEKDELVKFIEELKEIISKNGYNPGSLVWRKHLAKEKEDRLKSLGYH